MELHWPQIAYIALTFLGLGVTAAKDGEPDTHSFWLTLLSMLIVYFLLYSGGFFTGGCKP